MAVTTAAAGNALNPAAAQVESAALVRARATAASPRVARVACPFCSLLCDDLLPGDGAAANSAPTLPAGAVCPKASAGFARSRPAASPQVAGRDVHLSEAIDAAAAIIKAASLPLYGGLATDVDGMRGLLDLADATGGVVDHGMSAGAFRNISVMQSRGWVMTTLSEVRNRADLVVVVGDGIGGSYPRFYERIAGTAASMFGALDRQVVLIGNGADAAMVRAPVTVETIAARPDGLGAAVAALRGALRGSPVPPGLVNAGIDTAALTALADRIKSAKYPVFVWSPALLPEADGDLIVLSICDLVRDLNATQRAAGLSLAGSEGGATAMAVTAWQTGYPMRVSLATGIPVYDPVRFDISAMLARADGDALIWTAAIGAGLSLPATTIPTVVIGTPGLALSRTPEVYIPVGTPGLDHDGDLVRTDSVVTLHLRGTRTTGLPSVADVARALAARLAL